MGDRFTRRGFVGASLAAAALSGALRAAPTVYPTGTTIYDPTKAWNGFTVLSTLDTPAVLVIDIRRESTDQFPDLRKGDFITHVDDDPVRTPEEFEAAVKGKTGSVKLQLWDRNRTVVVETGD